MDAFLPSPAVATTSWELGQPFLSLCTAPSFSHVVQWLTHVQLFETPWTAAFQASLSFTISWSLLRLISIELDGIILARNNLENVAYALKHTESSFL